MGVITGTVGALLALGVSGLRQLGIGVAAAAVTSGLGRLSGTVVGSLTTPTARTVSA